MDGQNSTHTHTHRAVTHVKILNSDDLFFLLPPAPGNKMTPISKKKTKQNDDAHLFFRTLFRMKNRNKNDSVDIRRVEKKKSILKRGWWIDGETFRIKKCQKTEWKNVRQSRFLCVITCQAKKMSFIPFIYLIRWIFVPISLANQPDNASDRRLLFQPVFFFLPFLICVITQRTLIVIILT